MKRPNVMYTLMKFSNPFFDCRTGVQYGGTPTGKVIKTIGYDLYFIPKSIIGFMFNGYRARGKWFVIRKVLGEMKVGHPQQYYDLMWPTGSRFQAYRALRMIKELEQECE